MTGLIGWWPLHENSGTTARDLSGNGNHGSLNGGVTQGVAGKGGLVSYNFDGSDDHINIPNLGDLDVVTLSSWVYFSSVDNTWDAITNNDWSSGGFHFQRRPSDLTDNPNTIQLASKDGGSINSQKTITENQWYHLAAVINTNQNEMELYINGQLSSSGSAGTSPYDGSTVNIGAWNDGGTLKRHHQGKIQDFRTYNRALSPQEIQTLYEWGSGDYASPPTDGTAYYPLDGNATDKWGSKNGTTKGGVSWVKGKRGQAASFDGTDDYINVSSVSPPSEISLSVWVNIDSHQSGARIMNYDNAGIEYRVDSNGISFFHWDGSIRGFENVGNVPTGSWVNIIATFNGSTKLVYKNGVKIHSVSDVGWDTSESNLGIGASNGGDNPVDGQIDDVRIYPYALEPWQVQELYQWGTRGRDMRKLTVNARGGQ